MIDLGVEVEIPEGVSFSVIRESLERIGVANKVTKTLYPSCYILSKRGKYYIIFFKKLFILDGKEAIITDEDNLRESGIAKLLEKWGLVKIISGLIERDVYPNLFVLSHKDKQYWTICNKYNIGSVKKGIK